MVYHHNFNNYWYLALLRHLETFVHVYLCQNKKFEANFSVLRHFLYLCFVKLIQCYFPKLFCSRILIITLPNIFQTLNNICACIFVPKKKKFETNFGNLRHVFDLRFVKWIEYYFLKLFCSGILIIILPNISQILSNICACIFVPKKRSLKLILAIYVTFLNCDL